MSKKLIIPALVTTAIIGAASLSNVYAEDRFVQVSPPPEEPITQEPEIQPEAAVETAGVEEADDSIKFTDAQHLEDTLIGWQEEKVTSAEDDLNAAKQALGNAPEGSTQEELDELQAAVDDAQTNYDDAVANFDEEKIKLTEQIGELTEEQLIALNRSLHNATNNGLIVDLNSDYMTELLDGNYNKQQINSLTKALEEEAKFDKLSDKFSDKYDQTGNEKFLAKADMMSTKGDRQKDKFLGKIDKFDRSALDVGHKDKARKAARDSAKNAAHYASKNSARKEAKRSAKSEAKRIAKEKSRENARNKVKSNNGKTKA